MGPMVRRNLLILFLCFSTLAVADYQVWETQTLGLPLCKNVTFQWESQTRFQHQLIHVYSQENLVWRLSPAWETAFNYRNSWTRTATGWHTRHHPMFDFTRIFTNDWLRFSFRNRFFINLDRKDFTWRGRALFEILLGRGFYLVTGDELFLRKMSQFFENRVLAALEYRFVGGTSASVGYILRVRKHDNTNILAFRLAYTF